MYIKIRYTMTFLSSKSIAPGLRRHASASREGSRVRGWCLNRSNISEHIQNEPEYATATPLACARGRIATEQCSEQSTEQSTEQSATCAVAHRLGGLLLPFCHLRSVPPIHIHLARARRLRCAHPRLPRRSTRRTPFHLADAVMRSCGLEWTLSAHLQHRERM